MLSITPDQILALAPDDASRKAGQGLSGGSKWQNTGANPRTVWGECQGSGSKPYQTSVDAGSLTFKCSCPSRKFPCKHGVGLLLLFAKDAARFSTPDEPLWVSEWMDKRKEKAAAPAAKKEDKPKDEAAQAKRQAAREDKVSGGIEALRLWMKDALRAGILQLPEKGARYFDDMAKRLVDAQATGLARMVRELGNINYFAEGWHTEALDGLARLHLAMTGFRHLAAAPDADAALLHDVRAAIGFAQGNEALEGQPTLADEWLVAGAESESEGALTVEKHWLLSSEGRRALFLQYVPYGQRPGVSLFPGQRFRGEVQYYPSAAPLRVVVRNPAITTAPGATPLPAPLAGWQEVAQREAESLSRWPLLRELPHAIAGLRPVQTAQGAWLLEDRAGKHMRLHPAFGPVWHWMALCGGDYLPTAVLGAEHTYKPLGLWHNDTYIHLG